MEHIRRQGIVPCLVLMAMTWWGCAPGSAETRAPEAGQQARAAEDWPVVGGDPYGTRYSSLDQINRENVAGLEVAWSYRTGESAPEYRTREEPILESTPIVVDGTMYLSTPLGRVIALDPATGEERWTYDPRIDRNEGYGDFTNRGVTTWLDSQADEAAPCRRRIFVAPIDARLIALDALSGLPCADFGRGGEIDLRQGLRIPPFEYPAYQTTSPPVVAGDLVITGSAIADNSRTAPASGEVRAFDARTGELRWSWDPIPQGPADPAFETWVEGSANRTGAANVWSIMVVDPERGLVFAPTSSPAPDYFGGERLGENRYANSIVALHAETGEVAWSFQTIHHDLWDYDNASPPALVDLLLGNERVPAVLQTTKTGQLFVLHRETGDPLFGVEERAVPASDIPGEQASPTQPFTAEIEPLSPHAFSADDVWGLTPEDREACREMVAGLRNEGIFTPPSLQGTLVMPSNIGGAHWGGLAHDPERQLAIVPVNRIAAMVQLIPADGFSRRSAEAESDRLGLGYEYNVMGGTPYAMRRRFLRAPSGIPCTPPPFGELVAISLKTGLLAWSVPLGLPTADPGLRGALPPGLGSPNLGGPIATAGGLVFIAASLDEAIRAFDIETGAELWKADLPAWGRATPMTYEAGGRQFVVISAGAGGTFGEGDYVTAFSLP
jgi:quinoprotein glucose dehydrogenase